MQFNPYIRWRMSNYPKDRVIVICRESEKYIWRDIATEFEFIERRSYSSHRWLFKNKKPEISYQLRRKLGVKQRISGNLVLIPSQKNCKHKKMRIFKHFGALDKEKKYDIVFHARGAVKYGTEYRNWPIKNYVEFIDRMGKDLRMCSVGVEAHHIPGTEDMREIPLEELCTIIRSSSMVFGPACGFMGLANLCQTPAFMWTDPEIQEGFGGKDINRFRSHWRPFKYIPMKIIEKYGWQPIPRKIFSEFCKFERTLT